MWVAALPSTSTMPTWRWSRPVVLLDQPLEGDRGGRAVVEVGERQALVGDVGVGLGGDGADPGDGGRHGRPHGQELGGDGHAPGLSVGGPGHDREGHAPRLAISACVEVGLRSEDVRVLDRIASRLGFPSVGHHRRFVTAIAVDAVGSGVFMPISLLYFLAMTDLSLVQVGSALSLASAVAMPVGPVRRQPRRPVRRQARDARRQPAPGRRVPRLPGGRLLRRAGAVDDRRHDRPHGRSGAPSATSSPRSRRRGSASSGSASSGRCATSASPSAGCWPASRSRSARTSAFHAVVVANAVVVASPSCCCSPSRPCHVTGHRATASGWGVVLRDRAYRLLWVVQLGFSPR